MDQISDRDPILPVQVVWQGLNPFLDQAIPPSPSPEDRPGNFPAARHLFSYAAPMVPFSPTVKREWSEEGLVIEEIEYQTGPLTRATAFVLKPIREKLTPLPGILLFHCHSGVYRWGKEKVLARPGDLEELIGFRQAKYDGRSLAHDLARKGFIVMVPDAFYFGSRALGREGDVPPGEIEKVRKNSEHLVAKMLILAGHSWPAITAWEDRRALDYLWLRPEVDRSRVGCLGLSYGGFRSILLAAQDRRILSLVSSGWLTTTADLLQEKIKKHSWMVLPIGIFPETDFPLLAATAYPAAFMALLCTQDHLFTLDGMKTASALITSSYRQSGREDRCSIQFFESPHRMTGEMQDQAIHWMERFLGREETF